MILRKMEIEDGQQFLELTLMLDQETAFMLYEPHEREATVEEMENRIEGINLEGKVLGVEEDGKLVGFICAIRGNTNRTKHSAYLVIGVLQEYSGRGYGGQLIQAIDHWAKEKNISKIELTVMAHNERAIHLYKKHGFEKEGVKRQSVLIDGVLKDEYYMGKILT